jgi:hypothetical protein
MKGCDSPFGKSVGDGSFSIAWAPFTTTIAPSYRSMFASACMRISD